MLNVKIHVLFFVFRRKNCQSLFSLDVCEHFRVFLQLSEGELAQTVPKDEEPVASCVPHCYTQDVCLACRLPPGFYTIVPSTYQPGCSASFTLSLACRIHRLARLFLIQVQLV